MTDRHVVVIGAGMGGLAASVRLAARGLRVTLLEGAQQSGGKMREVAIGSARIDSRANRTHDAPSLEDLFAIAGASLRDHLRLEPAYILARHAWGDDQRLDLFADRERSVDAIGVFSGAKQAQLFRAFCARADDMWRTLEQAFIHLPNPTPLAGTRLRPHPGRTLKPRSTLWRDLGASSPTHAYDNCSAATPPTSAPRRSPRHQPSVSSRM